MRVRTPDGEPRWGRHGAAGILLHHNGRVLLARRAPTVDHPGTWAFPAGALNPGETPWDAAVREFTEELRGATITVHTVTSLSRTYPGGWEFTTFTAHTHTPTALQPGPETTAVEWVPVGEVDQRPLHPDFAQDWPRLRAALVPVTEDGQPVWSAPPGKISPYGPPPAPGTVMRTGWRYWMACASGDLIGVHVVPARIPWLPGAPVRAVCGHRPPPHHAPAPDCECGVRIVPKLADLLAGLVDDPARTGCTEAVWRTVFGQAVLADRRAHGVTEVPDVIGEVEYWGAVEPACPWDDPAGVVRAEFARVRLGGRLLLSGHLAAHADALRARYPTCRVVVGERRGLDWVREIGGTAADVA